MIRKGPWAMVWNSRVTRAEMLGMGLPPFSTPPGSANTPTPSPI